MFVIDPPILFYPFWGLDVGAIKSSIAKSRQAKYHITIDANVRLTLLHNTLTTFHL